MSEEVTSEATEIDSESHYNGSRLTVDEVVSQVSALRHKVRLRWGGNNRQIDRHAELGTVLRMAYNGRSTPGELIYALCISKHPIVRNLGTELSNGETNGSHTVEENDVIPISDDELRIYERRADAFLASVCMETAGRDDHPGREQAYELAKETSFATPLKVFSPPAEKDTHAA